MLSAALLLLGLAQAGSRLPPPSGVIVPPYEPMFDRPVVQSSLVVRGEGITTVDLDEVELPLTPEYVRYANARFEGWPEPTVHGFWEFVLVRFEVTEVITAGPQHGSIKPGDVIDIYLPMGVGLATRDSPHTNDAEQILFLDPYAHPEGGNVSPYSKAGSAFVVARASHGVIGRAPADDPCPGRAVNSSGSYVLDMAASKGEVDALAARLPGEKTSENAYIRSPHLKVRDKGSMALTPRNTFSSSPWVCEDLVAYDDVANLVEGSRK